MFTLILKEEDIPNPPAIHQQYFGPLRLTAIVTTVYIVTQSVQTQ